MIRVHTGRVEAQMIHFVTRRDVVDDLLVDQPMRQPRSMSFTVTEHPVPAVVQGARPQPTAVVRNLKASNQTVDHRRHRDSYGWWIFTRLSNQSVNRSRIDRPRPTIASSSPQRASLATSGRIATHDPALPISTSGARWMRSAWYGSRLRNRTPSIPRCPQVS